MRPDVARTRGVLIVLLAGTALLLWAGASFAAPTLGADCGAGASIVGSDSAGKVEIGTGARTCTLTFTLPPLNAPACTATNETNGGGRPVMVGVRTTRTTLVMDPLDPWNAGDVVSYLCVGY